MTYSNYMLMYYIALAATIVLLLVTVLLFFVLRIPKAFNDLTGRTERKAIKSINEQREAGKLSHDTAGAETDRMGMPATDKISESGRILDENPANTVVTEKIQTDTLAGSAETTVLQDGSGETTLLSDNTQAGETTLLQPQMNQSSPQYSGETTLLDESQRQEVFGNETAPLTGADTTAQAEGFVKEIENITFIHTAEIVL
ncbi:MAG: hypothetical protein V8S39_02695 [Lachnospiraceae bacterium]